MTRRYAGVVDRSAAGLETGGLDDLRVDHAVEIPKEQHCRVEVALQRGGHLRRQLRQPGADLVELRQHAAAVDRDTHLIVATEIALGGGVDREATHAVGLSKRGGRVFGADLEQGAGRLIGVRGDPRAGRDGGAELIQTVVQRVVRGGDLGGGLGKSRRGCRAPLRVQVGDILADTVELAQPAADPFEAGHCRVDLPLLGQYRGAAGRVAACEDERAGAVSQQTRAQGVYGLQEADSLQFAAYLAQVPVHGGEIEEPDQDRRHELRQHQGSQLLPEIQTFERQFVHEGDSGAARCAHSSHG